MLVAVYNCDTMRSLFITKDFSLNMHISSQLQTATTEEIIIQMKYIILLINIFFLLGLQAQESLSLADAIQKGLENNFQIKIAEQNIKIAQNNNTWYATGRYPIVDASLSNNNSFINQNNPASFLSELSSVGTGLTPAVNANWVIYNGNQFKINKQQLEQLELQGEVNAEIAIETTTRSIILAYYQALIQQERIGTLEELLDLSRDRIAREEVRQEFGQAGRFDVLQTQDAYLNDSTTYLIQIQNLENAFYNLNLAMGEDVLATRYQLSDAIVYDAPDYKLEELKKTLLEDNRNLQNLFVSRELGRIGTRLAEASRSPIVSLGAGASYDFRLSQGSGTTQQGMEIALDAVQAKTLNGFINIGASYRLYDGGARKRSIENAQMQEIITQLNIEDLKRNLAAQLEIALGNYNNQKRLLDISSTLVQNAQENLDIANERFKGAQISSFDYRAIQLAYLNAQQSRLDAFFNLKTIETDIIQLIGGLVK